MLRRPLLWAPDGDAGVGGIDDTCLALIRPVYSGGTWAPGDASLSDWAVTNYSIAVGAEGTGPWGGTSRAFVDSSAAARCFVIGGSAFGAVRSGSSWFFPTAVGDANGQIFFKISRNTAARPYVGIGYMPAPSPDASTHIRLFAYCAESSTTNPFVIATSTTIYPINYWIFCGIILPATTPGPVYLWADGEMVATTGNTTPALGQSDAAFGVGSYWNDGTYDAVGRYAEAGIWSVERDLSVVPSGPYTED